jgi:Putative Flp pilus-assembly TadE/G-like
LSNCFEFQVTGMTSMNTHSRLENERGAIIIHVALALFALIAFSAFVIDMGVMWVSRRQAQNAADAGALAGGVGLMKDGGSPTEAAKSALQWANGNAIFGTPNSSANVRITFSGPTGTCGTSCDVGTIPPCGNQRGCVRVDVFRNTPDRPYRGGTTLGAPVPTLFAPLLGVTQQGVRATATAEIASGNMVRCMLPFAVADRWGDAFDENVDIAHFANDGQHLLGNPIGGWSPNDLYQDAAGGGSPPDFYAPPYHPGHTGWTVAGDYGRQLILKDGEVGQFSAGWANKVDLPGSVGADDYRQDIRGCNPTVVGIATEAETCAGYPPSGTTIPEAKAGCLGVSSGLSAGPTGQGVESKGGGGGLLPVVEQDPGARWSWAVTGPDGQPGGVVNAGGALNMSSPRIRPVAVFDIARYMTNASCVNQAGTGCTVKVVNIIGFFLEGMCDTVAQAKQLDPGVNCSPDKNVAKNEVVGRIVTLPAAFFAGSGDIEEDAAFLQVLRLVR